MEAAIHELVPPPDTPPQRLHAAMRHSMEAGGKRIRPMLLLAAADIFPADADPMPAAVALECLHTYTLIHDDLPSVDDSDLRRGQPSCHAKFGEATALLAGDALLTLAFELLATRYADHPTLAAALVRELATAAGSRRLIGGQMADILGETQRLDADALRDIHANKTAALIEAALAMGLRFGEPDEAALAAIRRAGHHIGLSFQIIDDILDATSDSGALGKPTGNDAATGKNTYVALYGIEGARGEARTHTRTALSETATIGGDHTALDALVRELEQRIA